MDDRVDIYMAITSVINPALTRDRELCPPHGAIDELLVEPYRGSNDSG
jgi:hypothetical protein